MSYETPIPPEQAPDPSRQPTEDDGSQPRKEVEEVVAVPMTESEARGPVIEVPQPPTPASSPPASSAGVPPIDEPIIPPYTSSSDVPPPPPPPTSYPPPPPQSTTPATPSVSEQRKRRIWSILCHLMLLLVIPTAFLGIALTFLIWQLKGKRDRQVEDQGREALNFQINVAALTALLGISCFAAPLLPIAWLVAVIMCIVAARHASDGELYRYPWVLRIVTH